MAHDADNLQPGSSVSQLVVIGASAGGIHALSTLVATLPTDFPAPIVIAQHLDPGRRSQLEELLTSSSTLPVRTVQEIEPLRPGTIYVVPADRDVEVTDHHVSLRSDLLSRSRPSVNRLLSTAAQVYGEGLIAVILTGLGSDGAAGAVTVQAYGGTVVVQNPETAAYSDMPLAVPPEAIDVVADLEAIGLLLVELLTGTYAIPLEGEGTDLEAILSRLRERTGLDFGAYKRPTIERRLQRRMASLGLRTVPEYRRHIDRHPEELQRLEASFLIKVTKFFRDPDLFSYLRDTVLPTLLTEAQERGELRIWSAGCATGEEAYSLAIVIAELLGDAADGTTVRLFATDVSTEAIEFARHGVYPLPSLDGVPPAWIERYFVRLDGSYQIHKAIRSMVVFAAHDLGHRAPFPRIDLILCRNVLIYFTADLQRRVLQRFAFSLRRGGYLVLGKAETVSALPDYFTIEHPSLRVYRRMGEAPPIQVDRTLDSFRLEQAAVRPSPRRPVPIPPHLPVPQQDGIPVDHLGVGVATVDRQYHVRAMNSAARRLLGLRGPGTGEDLVHAVERSLAAPLRSALDAALRDETTTSVHHLGSDPADDTGRDIAIVCRPLQSAEWRAGIDLVLIEVIDISSTAAHQREIQGELDRLQVEWRDQHVRLESDRDQALGQAERAVAEVREVRAANDAMAAEQTRLRAEVEQLYLFAEEAQASSEEIETLNEELQASNEDLETLNEELQATVEELQTTNDELHTRGLELEVLASSLEDQRHTLSAERDRLGAVLTHMSDAVVVVVESEQVVLANAAYERFAASLADAEPERSPGEPLPPDEWLMPRAARGETFTLSFTVATATGDRRWFEASGQPVQGDGMHWG